MLLDNSEANDTYFQPVSTAAEFTYEQPPEHLQKENDEKLMQIFEKIRIMACAFNAYSSVEVSNLKFLNFYKLHKKLFHPEHSIVLVYGKPANQPRSTNR